MLKFNKLLLGTLVAATMFTACKKDKNNTVTPAPTPTPTPTPVSDLEIPDNYDGASFATNTADVKSKLDAFSALITKCKSGAGAKVTEADLTGLYTFKSDVSTQYANYVTVYLKGIAASSGNTFPRFDGIDGLFKSTTGGAIGDRLLDKSGIEYIQLADKGMYGSFLYYQATQLLKKDMTLADVDKAVAYFGAQPTFDNDGGAEKDKFMAKYASKRSTADKGIYINIKKGFIKLQAAIKANDAKYDADKEDAIKMIKENWEKAFAAQTIHYFFEANDGFTKTGVTIKDQADALHAYSEGIGFMSGLLGLSAKMDNAKILAWATAALASPQDIQCKLYVTDAPGNASKLGEGIKTLQAAYGFSDAEVASFK